MKVIPDDLDMRLFNIEQDIRDLEETLGIQSKEDKQISKKLLKIADELSKLQNC